MACSDSAKTVETEVDEMKATQETKMASKECKETVEVQIDRLTDLPDDTRRDKIEKLVMISGAPQRVISPQIPDDLEDDPVIKKKLAKKAEEAKAREKAKEIAKKCDTGPPVSKD